MNVRLRNALLFVLMLCGAGLAVLLRANQKLTEQLPKVNLEEMIPRTFVGWREDDHLARQIVDPRQKQQIEKIYDQTLARTYRNSGGEAIMLSIAYGGDQSDTLQVHLPDGCYAGEGFSIGEESRGILATGFKEIPVTRLVASRGMRVEPITYWMTTAGKPSNNSWDMKKAKLEYTLRGKVPDGILIRVSSIGADTVKAWQTHHQFVAALLESVSPESRVRLIGTPDR